MVPIHGIVQLFVIWAIRELLGFAHNGPRRLMISWAWICFRGLLSHQKMLEKERSVVILATR